MNERSSSGKPRVLIAGGGVTGLEALLALSDLAGERIELMLLAPEPDFVYKPLLVEEPFALGPAERHELAPLVEERGARLVRGALWGCGSQSTPRSSTTDLRPVTRCSSCASVAGSSRR